MQSKELVSLYQKSSKHSNYQVLPEELRDYIPENVLNINSRYEEERLEFMLNQLDFKRKTVLDIGGNTGYFSFELLDEGAGKVVFVEGNEDHAEFVRSAAQMLEKPIKVINDYMDFDGAPEWGTVDITLLLNVVHHLGDDFGDEEISLAEAREEMEECINYFSDKTDWLVFQMGYCWKGDTSKLLFENGTKREMIDFVEEASAEKWEIESIGIPEKKDDEVVYSSPTEENMKRRDDWGEFLNRPLFIMRSVL